MPNWTVGFLKYKDDDGNEKQVVAYLSDDATVQHIPSGVLFGPDFADPDQMIAASIIRGTNGDGLAVVNLADSAVKGVNDHDQAITRPPLLLGAVGLTSAAVLTPVTSGRITRLSARRDGVLITQPFGAPQDQVSSGPVALNSTSETDLITAPTTDLRLVLLSVHVSNESAVTVSLSLLNGAGGSVIDRLICPAGAGRQVIYPGGLWPMSVQTKLVGQLSATPTSSQVYVTVNAINSKLP